MKLHAKHCDGEKVRRVHDPAKTPFQRLLLSGIVPAERRHQLCEVAQALDPLGLLRYVEHLQQALRACASHASPLTQSAPSASILYFCVQRCMKGALASEEKAPAPELVLYRLQGEQLSGTGLLDWPRTSRDPFEGQWELFPSLVLAHPEWSGGDLFQEMQRLLPGRYLPSHQRTLQWGSARSVRAC